MTNLLLIVVLLWVTIKIPGMMRKFATRQGSMTKMAEVGFLTRLDS